MTKEELLTHWQRTLVRLQIEHELSARAFEKYNWKLGIPVVVLTTVVGASIFGTLQENELLALKIGTGCLSVLSVVLSSLQTFFNFGARAGGHKVAADRLGELSREAQEKLALGLADAELAEYLAELRQRWDSISREAPNLRNSTIKAMSSERLLQGDENIPKVDQGPVVG